MSFKSNKTLLEKGPVFFIGEENSVIALLSEDALHGRLWHMDLQLLSKSFNFWKLVRKTHKSMGK